MRRRIARRRLRIESLECRRLLAITQTAQDTEYLRPVYDDLLDRVLDDAGAVFWREQLASASDSGIVLERLVRTDEARQLEIREVYEGLLDRTAGAAETADWVEEFNAGLSEKDFIARVAGSPEYYSLQGGTNDAFVDALYLDLLGRASDADGKVFWTALAASRTHDDVVRALLDSQETQEALVRNWYERYLHRAADIDGLAYFREQLAQGVASEALRASILNSPEYRDLHTDAVVEWNQTLLDAVQATSLPPPKASRLMAMVHTAVFDAVNSIEGGYQQYASTPNAPAGADPIAAAAAAAHRVLVHELPALQATFDAALAKSLSRIADGPNEDAGVAVGEAAADAVIALRANDHSTDVVNYVPGANPGDWVPTPLGFAPALLPQWPLVTPFAMSSGDQFRFNGPPDLTTAQWAAEYNETIAYGKSDSTVRTPDQTQIALFWADGAGTFTPPGHWNQIAQESVYLKGGSLLERARLFALLDISLADAAISAWDAKYAFEFWRPVTAAAEAANDGNPATDPVPGWAPLLSTPPFPEYTSGHSTFSGAADAVLTALLGDEVSFSTTSPGLAGIERTYDNYTEAANEAGQSRIYGGIHFQSANQHGLLSGRSLGQYVVASFLNET